MERQEKLYKTLGHTGIVNMVCGIVVTVTGVGAGVMMIVYGAKLLLRRSDVLL